MKKIYNAPILEEEKVEIEDVIATSGQDLSNSQAGDSPSNWPF